MSNDYYETLGVAREASDKEISEAYRALAKKYHPDVNKEPDASKKFKEIAEAFEVLGDKDKKYSYDHAGPYWSDLTDLYKAESRVKIVETYVELTWREAALGCKKIISIDQTAICDKCTGTGAAKSKTCPSCKGQGINVISKAPFVMQMVCSQCKGKKVIIEKKCKNCKGHGEVVTGQQQFEVDIFAGIDNNVRIRRGNIIVNVFVQPDKFYKKISSNGDISLKVPLKYRQFVLGDEIEVPTLYGKASVKIPPNTQPGTQFRLKQLGIRNYEYGVVGDMYILTKLEIPNNPADDEHKKVLDTLTEFEEKNSTFGEINSYNELLNKKEPIES